jgi:glycosyltransferase involved in cell wall biosynthesis
VAKHIGMSTSNNAETDGGGACELAVVIPVWRGRHLRQALASLREQTDGRFRVYLGDDASPDAIADIVAEERGGMDLTLHRFEANLGGKDLVGQWHRCIALTRGEPWIWLFADDDEAELECVAAFYAAKRAEPAEVALFRFHIKVIDDQGGLMWVPDRHPPRETSDELFWAILGVSRRAWRAPDHVFSRRVYEEQGGFVQFPAAFFSDWATWVKFARPGGVVTIRGAELRWRSHAQGTSSQGGRTVRIFNLEALVLFVDWFVRMPKERWGADGVRWAVRCREFFLREIRYKSPVPVRLWPRLLRAGRTLGMGWRGDCKVAAGMVISHVRHWPLVSWWLMRRLPRTN